jgi:hypothetical protein
VRRTLGVCGQNRSRENRQGGIAQGGGNFTREKRKQTSRQQNKLSGQIHDEK